MRGGPGDSGADGRARGLDDDDEQTREAPGGSGLGGARVADLGDGESTRADPTDEELLPVARPRTARGRGVSGAVQIDAVDGERVPALVVRRSAQELRDPASGVRPALAPGAVDLESLMGRSLGSPAADAPPSRRSLPAQGDAPPSRSSLPPQSRSPVPEPSSRRSLPAQAGVDAPSGRISLPPQSRSPEPSSRRSLPAQVGVDAPSGRISLPPQSRSPVPEPSSRRSLPAQVGVDAPSGRISLPPQSRSPVPEPSSRRSLPAQVGIDAPSGRISLPLPGGRPSASPDAAREGREVAAAREVTHIDAAAAIGLAPEPRPLAIDDADDRTPPPRIPLGVAWPGHVGPPPNLAAAEVAIEPLRAPRPRVPTALDLRQPIPMPARALRGDGGRSPWVPVFAVALVAGLVLLAVGTRGRERARTPPVTAVASLAAEAPPPPEGARGVRLVTRPPRARVAVDGFELGPAPMLLRPRDGRTRYPLVVRAPGYKPWSGTLRLEGASVALELGDSPAPGAAVVTSDDEGPAISVALEHE